MDIPNNLWPACMLIYHQEDISFDHLFLPQHLKDKFWNFIFYKFIFIFGVLNVQTVEEVVMWCLWFSALVFLHLMVQLCKDRFEYVSIINNNSLFPFPVS